MTENHVSAQNLGIGYMVLVKTQVLRSLQIYHRLPAKKQGAKNNAQWTNNM
jgi:hypothetical protein